MSFDIAIGLASDRGPRERNEDFAAVQRPQDAREAGKGWIAALADGVSGQPGQPGEGGGRMAAQTTVGALVRDYHATPRHWDTTVALDRLIAAQNGWLAHHNRRGERSALTTLSAVVLQGGGYTVAHVGDSRVWLIREGQATQLTQDHAIDQSDFARLTRAIGLDDTVRVDYAQGDLRAGDRLLLTSDGVHGPLRASQLAELAMGEDAQAAAEALVRAALEAGGRDNATALLVLVRAPGIADYDDLLRGAQRLPVPPRMKAGDLLDGLRITALVADNGVHRLFRARRDEDLGDLRPLALKTLAEARGDDPQERAMLAHEGWVTRRVGDHPGLVRGHETPDASALYLLADWHDGRTLEDLMAEGRPALADFLAAAGEIAAALGRLHRAGIVHRDIKPGNLHLGDDGRWRLLDLGVALSGHEPEALRDLHAGTPSYINPEQWDDPPAPADAGSDLFALGVTLYQWLTGRLPYGEIEPYQRGRYRHDPRPPSRLRPDVPIWLDRLLLKAVHREAAARFETADELLLALERGASRPLPAAGGSALARRNPLAAWQLAFGLSALLNLLLLVWLLFLPR